MWIARNHHLIAMPNWPLCTWCRSTFEQQISAVCTHHPSRIDRSTTNDWISRTDKPRSSSWNMPLYFCIRTKHEITRNWISLENVHFIFYHFVYLPFDTLYKVGGGLRTAGFGTGSCHIFGRDRMASLLWVGTSQIFFASLLSTSSKRIFRLLMFGDGLGLRLRLELELGLKFGLMSGVRHLTWVASRCRPIIVRIKPYRFRLIHKSNAPTLGRNEYLDDFTSDMILKKEWKNQLFYKRKCCASKKEIL